MRRIAVLALLATVITLGCKQPTETIPSATKPKPSSATTGN
jgi:hypothetical protein